MKIGIVAFDDCMSSAVYGLLDAFSIAGMLAARAGLNTWAALDIQLVTASGGPVVSHGGFAFAPQSALTAFSPEIVVVAPILGDVGAVLAREQGLVEDLARVGAGAQVCASVCTGAFLLAEAGLLAGRRITTNPAYETAFRARYPDVELALDERIVADRRVICAGSTTAFLDLAVHLVDRIGGHDLAVATAKALSMDRYPGSQRLYRFFTAPRDHGDEAVLRIQDWLEDGHETPLNIADLARAGGMSRRNLDRRFRAATGLSPADYLRQVRMERAKRMLETETLSTEQVAQALSYADSRAFTRAFQTYVGCAPGEYRRRFQRWAPRPIESRSSGSEIG